MAGPCEKSPAQPSLLATMEDANIPSALVSVVSAIADACQDIADVLRAGPSGGGGTHQVGSRNEFGDEQLEVDLSTEAILRKYLKETGHVAAVSSEESPTEDAIACDSESPYAVAFDPLDGSSIVGCNWAVGTIVSTRCCRRDVAFRISLLERCTVLT